MVPVQAGRDYLPAVENVLSPFDPSCSSCRIRSISAIIFAISSESFTGSCSFEACSQSSIQRSFFSLSITNLTRSLVCTATTLVARALPKRNWLCLPSDTGTEHKRTFLDLEKMRYRKDCIPGHQSVRKYLCVQSFCRR
jgi:hypothetical protein